MDEESENRRFYQWRDRVHEFGLKYKEENGDADYIPCPCTDCANTESHRVVDV